MCIEYASAVGELTREAASAAAPLRPVAPLLLNRDARHPFGSTLSRRLGETAEKAPTGDSRAVNGCWQEREEVPRVHKGIMNSLSHGEVEAGDLIVDAVLTSPPYPGVYDYLGEARYARSQLGNLPRPTPPGDPAEGPGRVAVREDSVKEDAALGIRCHAEAALSSRAASVFVDSPVPSGRDWPSTWTDGEIGAKSDVRRRRRNTTLACSDLRSRPNGTHSLEAAGGESGVHAQGGLACEWSKDQREWLMATAGILRNRGGRMAVMVGDGDGLDTRSSLIEEIETLASIEGQGALSVVGWATLRAAPGARRSMRTEHLVLIEKS